MSDFRDTLATVDKRGFRKWLYPPVVWGYFLRRRTAVVVLLLAIYLVTPWLTVDGKQAVLLDIAQRRFIFFGTTFWATDTRFLLLLLGFLGFSLFFWTALFGRIWCGWACPETVFLEFLYRPVERLIEGNAAARQRLDAAPISAEKLFKKSLKFLIFAALSWFIANTFVAYIVGQEPLLRMMSRPPWEHWTPFVVMVFITGLTFFQFAWFREQFCTVVCPYARLQSVMLDPHSLMVGYDVSRGEPRGKLKRGVEPPKGDCIDCGLCVRVCPTGIDIRDGLQLECVQCAACADACDSVMVKINKPTGLVRYDTEKGLAGEPVTFVRPRVIIYAIVLIAYLCVFSYLLSTRELSEFQILRLPGSANFEILADGRVSNNFMVHISNKGNNDENYSMHTDRPAELKIITPGLTMEVKAGTDLRMPVFFIFPRELLKDGKLNAVVSLTNQHGFHQEQGVPLLGPND